MNESKTQINRGDEFGGNKKNSSFKKRLYLEVKNMEKSPQKQT